MSPDRTVTALRGIFRAAGGLYDRGKIVKMVDDQSRGGSVAHVMTPAALVMATHQAARPYLEKVQGDSTRRSTQRCRIRSRSCIRTGATGVCRR